MSIKEIQNKESSLKEIQIFKSIDGETPSQFIPTIRLQKEMELLKNSKLNIAEIAYEVGFKDSNYFSRVFQDEFGSSPTFTLKSLIING